MDMNLALLFECEARRLLKYKSADRAEALMKREEIRGKEATNALRELMTLIRGKNDPR
jgi:hypothetical protein